MRIPTPSPAGQRPLSRVRLVFSCNGLFCGWICPFGALQEIIFKIRYLLFKKKSSIELPIVVTNKLKYVKYIIFIFLTLVSLKSFSYAVWLAGIEPFKTMWTIGILNKSFNILSFYTILLLIIAIFTYRFFCRFLCPLGAFLSLLSIFTFLKLKRRGTCTICRICKKTCNSMAINITGAIDAKECFGCFTCLHNMYNHKICPAIKNEKLRNKYEKGTW